MFTKLLRFAQYAATAMVITQGSLTGQVPGVSHAATWNAVGTTFLAQTMDVTDTASAAGSLLARWRVGGVTQFSVGKTGLLSLGVTATPAALTATAFNAFASTVSGAVLMGYGTTNDVALMNRAGTVCLGVGPNTTTVNIPGTLAVTGTSTLTGNVGIGGASAANVAIYIQSSTLTTTGQFGYYGLPLFSSAATSSGRVFYGLTNTAAAAFTMSIGAVFYAGAPTLGAGSAITTQYGFYATNQGVTGVANAYGVYIAAQSGASTINIGLYNAGTTTLVGAVSMSATLAVAGNIGFYGQAVTAKPTGVAVTAAGIHAALVTLNLIAA